MQTTTSPAEPGCGECAAALTEPEHGVYMLQCPGCKTRMLSFGPPAWQALSAPASTRDPEPLRLALLSAFGEAGYLAARRRLWIWVQLRAAAAAAQPG
jgi:hypothetical protein